MRRAVWTLLVLVAAAVAVLGIAREIVHPPLVVPIEAGCPEGFPCQCSTISRSCTVYGATKKIGPRERPE